MFLRCCRRADIRIGRNLRGGGLGKPAFCASVKFTIYFASVSRTGIAGFDIILT